MKLSPWLLGAGVLAAIAYFSKNNGSTAAVDPSFSPAAATTPNFSSQVAQQALSNIATNYGQPFAAAVSQSVTTAGNTTAALAQLAMVPTSTSANTSSALRSGSAVITNPLTLAQATQQTNLSRGLGTGLANGTYNFSGTVVTVRSGGRGPGGTALYSTSL